MHKSITLDDVKKYIALHFPAAYKPCLTKGSSKEQTVDNWKIRSLSMARD